MKDINVNTDVRAKIESLIVELNGLCVANELPFVAATVFSKKQEENGVACERVVSCYINGATGATEPSILSAVKVLKQQGSRAPVAAMLLGAILSAASGDDDCSCPKCVARRAEAAKEA